MRRFMLNLLLNKMHCTNIINSFLKKISLLNVYSTSQMAQAGVFSNCYMTKHCDIFLIFKKLGREITIINF